MRSSIVPSIWLWLARICSIRVEPERGRPTTKIGSGAGDPVPACSAKYFAVNSVLQFIT